MAEPSEDLEIVIEKDPDEALLPEVVVEPDAKTPPEPKDVKPVEGLEALKAKLDTERAAREEAERRERAATHRATTAVAEAADSNLALVANAIETVKAKTESLKSRYREAQANGDVDALFDIQGEISQNAAAMVQLEQGRRALEAEAKQPAPRELPSDRVEALATQLSPKSAAWVRAHPEFARDDAKYQAMLGAHNLAVAQEGLSVDSDDYFDYIEERLNVRRPAEREDDGQALSAAAQPVQRRAAPPAAPVSRSGSPDGSRPNTVRLSPQEVEMAEMMGMSATDYAKNKLSLQKEGKIH